MEACSAVVVAKAVVWRWWRLDGGSGVVRGSGARRLEGGGAGWAIAAAVHALARWRCMPARKWRCIGGARRRRAARVAGGGRGGVACRLGGGGGGVLGGGGGGDGDGGCCCDGVVDCHGGTTAEGGERFLAISRRSSPQRAFRSAENNGP